jgi:hypothetical protein
VGGAKVAGGGKIAAEKIAAEKLRVAEYLRVADLYRLQVVVFMSDSGWIVSITNNCIKYHVINEY